MLDATSPAVRVRELRKLYSVHEREAGALAAVKSLVRRQAREDTAGAIQPSMQRFME